MAGPPGEVGLMEEESPAVTRLQQTVRELELELAQTKLALVESECKNQVRFFPLFENFSNLIMYKIYSGRKFQHCVCGWKLGKGVQSFMIH